MANYVQYTKQEFEQEVLSKIVHDARVPGTWVDITDAWRKENPGTFERIYCIPTYNRAVTIIVYSSVDIHTGKVREHGADRVRVIYRWNTRNGMIYRKGAWHNRVEGLFQNLCKTVDGLIKGAGSLSFDGWAKEVRSAL